jgi:hypothetical protein
MRKLIVTALAIGLALALQPAALAQFGGVVFDPTQSVHAFTQIEQEERSISNQFQHVMQQYQLTHRMILAPSMLYQRFLSPTTDLRMLQQISNTYGNSMGWLNSANTGNGAAAAYQQVSVPSTTRIISGYMSASVAGQQQIAAEGATVDIGDSVMSNNLEMLGTMRANQAARQNDIATLEAATLSQDATQQTIMATLQRINQALLLQLRSQQDANQMNANLALQQIVAQKQQQDAMKSAFRDSSGYESYYNANVATTSGGAANLLTQAY